MKIKIHISRAEGFWYALAGNNNPFTRAALVPAINYVRRMNPPKSRNKILAQTENRK